MSRKPPPELCDDCVSTRSPQPQPRQGRSKRCQAHRKQHYNHMAKGRNRRRAGETIKRGAWERQYKPQPLPDQRGGAYFSSGDLDELHSLINGLRDALIESSNFSRRGDPSALARGLSGVQDAIHEAITGLRSLAGNHKATDRQ